jgi:hypothetical protein
MKLIPMKHYRAWVEYEGTRWLAKVGPNRDAPRPPPGWTTAVFADRTYLHFDESDASTFRRELPDDAVLGGTANMEELLRKLIGENPVAAEFFFLTTKVVGNHTKPALGCSLCNRSYISTRRGHMWQHTDMVIHKTALAKHKLAEYAAVGIREEPTDVAAWASFVRAVQANPAAAAGVAGANQVNVLFERAVAANPYSYEL